MGVELETTVDAADSDTASQVIVRVAAPPPMPPAAPAVSYDTPTLSSAGGDPRLPIATHDHGRTPVCACCKTQMRFWAPAAHSAPALPSKVAHSPPSVPTLGPDADYLWMPPYMSAPPAPAEPHAFKIEAPATRTRGSTNKTGSCRCGRPLGCDNR